MRPRTKILAGAGVLVLAAFLAWLSWPKPEVKADAIKVVGFVGDQSVPGTNHWRLAVVVSNTTKRTFEVDFPMLQIGRSGSWTNASEPRDPTDNYFSHIGPHGCVTQEVLFLTNRPAGEWRLKFNVSARADGLNKLLWAKRMHLTIYDGLNPNQTIWAPYGEVVSPVFGSGASTNNVQARK